MVSQPSRRTVVAGCAGALVGAAAGYLGRPVLAESGTDGSAPVSLSWAPTEWPFPDYDAARTRHPPPASAPPEDLDVAWRLRDETVFGDAWASPVVANGRAFTAASDEFGTTVLAIDVDGGDVAWRREGLGEGDTDPALAAPGDGVTYRIEGSEAPLGQFGAATGERVWGVPEPPLGGWTVGAGRLYYGDRRDGRLRAYDARTGTALWTTAVDDERLVARSFHPAHGVFATALGTLYALDPTDGTVRWDRPVPEHIKSGPVVAGGRLFVTKWLDGMALLALDPATGDRQWRYRLSPTEVRAGDETLRRWYELGAVTPAVVVVRERRADATPGALHAVAAESGERRWRVEPPGDARAFSDPTVVGTDVYVTAAGEAESELLRLDLADGSVSGSWPLPEGAGAPLVAGGRVLVETRTGLVALA